MSAHILVVEDDDDLRLMLSIALERAGHEVASVDTGEEALARLEGDVVVDLVLLDIGLPGLDGFEVLSRMRRPLRTKVVAMSAHAHEELADRAIDLGCTTYLHKPFTPSELVAVLSEHQVLPA